MNIGNYQLIERIGTTAGGELYRARHLHDGTAVLLKFLDRDGAGVADDMRLRNEYALLQLLHVSEILRPIVLHEEGGHLALLLEHFAGEGLDTVLARQQRFALPVALAIAIQLARALAALHAAGIVHHDLRPANLLLARDGVQVKLADLSQATSREGATSARPAVADWAYVSPEQTGRMNRHADYRTDFYALGIVLHRLLTGQLPFQADDALEWVHCHLARMPVPPHQLVPDIPQVVSDLVLKLLAKAPEERYQSAGGLLADLEHCLAQWQATEEIAPFALGMRDVSDRLRIPHKLYGREQERAALLAAFEHMAASGKSALATASGYSGIGKSALVGELRQPIAERHGYFISGKFDQYQRDVPYATLTQAFRELVQQLLSESEASIAAWRQRIQEAVGVNGQLIIDVLPQIELIIGKQEPVPTLEPTMAKNRFRMVFREFIAVFAGKERPLVLFVDDLQWIDTASLELIEHVLAHPNTGSLLLIGAYRDNEVGPEHPLRASIEAIRQSGVPVTAIELAPLPLAALNQLVADTLHAQAARCESLTRLMFERTGGNPFFFTQFLGALPDEGLLQRHAQRGGWQWNLDRIATKDFVDNVVDLMVGRLRLLPSDTQTILQLASCLGNRFDLRRLAIVSGKQEHGEAARQLAAAVHEGFIACTGGVCKFLHDRIQQAAYMLIPQEHRSEIHLGIARLLVAHLTEDELAESLFEVVNQFNRGAALLADPDEKAQSAQINLRAARKARAAAAYASALAYLAAGAALLEKDCWEQQYELAFAIGFLRAECEFLNGEVAAAEKQLDTLWRQALNVVDRAAVTCLRVDVCTALDRSDRAIAAGLDYFRHLGIEWSPHPTEQDTRREYEQVRHQLGKRTIGELIDLPAMTDPASLATMDVLTKLMAPARYTDANLYALVACRGVTLSLEHGNCDGSCLPYGCFAIVAGTRFGDYQAGFAFGQLSYELVEQRGLKRFQAMVYLALAIAVIPWTQHIKTAADLLHRGFEVANKTGDLNQASYFLCCLITNMLATGNALGEVQHDVEKSLAFVQKRQFGFAIDIIATQLGLIRTLRGLTSTFGSLDDEQFDERRMECHFSSNPNLAFPECWYWVRKLQARFLAGDYDAAIAAASRAKRLLWTSLSLFETAEYHFYGALSRAAACDGASPEQRQEHAAALAAHHRQLLMWTENCPSNFENRAALTGAEAARIDGRDLDAINLYEQAIRSARLNGFVQNEALASELAGRFHFDHGWEASGICHLRNARTGYLRWEAHGKVKQLDERYPQLRALPDHNTADAGVAQLDALSIAKASQAISGRIVLEELIDTLMRIVLENAGAQAGYLLLAQHDDKLALVADAHVEQPGRGIRLHDRTTSPQGRLPTAILNYVCRSREQVLLMNAAEPHPFSADPYFSQQHPKSVLCLPILHQSALVGLLYLENNLTTHAFTPDRVQVLELLAGQAAISLENARLYTDVRESHARIQRLVDSNIIGMFFWDLQGAITEANEALLHMTGYSRDDLKSGALRWTDLTPPEYRETDAPAIEELKRTGSVSPYEKEFIRKDGNRIPILIGVTFFEKSQETGVAFVLDLSERKRAEAEREARHVAEAANQAKSTFLANMSHELRSPLNTLLGFARLMERQLALPPETREDLAIILRSGEHLRTLINQVLDLAKIEAGRTVLNDTDFDLHALLDELEDMFAFKADEQGLTLYVEQDDIPHFVHGDPLKLRQVLINLLSNALKFTRQGSVTVGITRRTVPAGLRFTVADTGPGMSAEELQDLFNPFVQTRTGQLAQEGTGLGLTISRNFVRLMGGELHIASQLGRGTTVSFDLPLQTVEAVAMTPTTERTEQQVIALAPGQPRYRLLIADDGQDARQLLVRLLAPLGFEVREAANGLEAVEIWETWQPHLIWMDMRMPVLDGRAATRRIKACANGPATVIIALTASSFEEQRADILAAGCDDFLRKPFQEGDLFGLMQKHLGVRFVYQEDIAIHSSVPVDAAALATLPAALRHTLEQALIRLDTVAVAHAIAEVKNASLAQALAMLANEFQYKRMLELIQDVD